ncbi:MAG: hypothetical protein JO329_11045 [Planctomycetaceae bacterium]|nr:hypothetical protein [Planctomycetaceae bacterium]
MADDVQGARDRTIGATHRPRFLRALHNPEFYLPSASVAIEFLQKASDEAGAGAFAAVTLAAEKELYPPPDQVNIYGGAVAPGHPVGCSGARILVALLSGLKRTGGERGIDTLCVGGGEGMALAVAMVARAGDHPGRTGGVA